MDVPFRGMQRQHSLVYLASVDNPSPAAGEASEVNTQMYPGFDMAEDGYLDFGLATVRICRAMHHIDYLVFLLG